MSGRSENWLNEARSVSQVLAKAPVPDKNLRIERAEFPVNVQHMVGRAEKGKEG